MVKSDPASPAFGLPDCLHVPIAASGPDAVETYVGPIVRREVGRSGRISALLVQSFSGFSSACHMVHGFGTLVRWPRLISADVHEGHRRPLPPVAGRLGSR